ncbi:MAG: acyltransferase [Alphaproteobacteria bacterium]|nr:acyltransferase [Alphaproteobacteria bacterium]
MPYSRIPALDALRGLAALLVVFTHAYAIWPPEDRAALFWISHTPLRLLINGSAGVTFFFVLSGFVLALPFLEGKRLAYSAFLLRRFCRIYLPFMVTLLLALSLRAFAGHAPVPLTSDWFNDQWAENFTAGAILGHLALMGTVSTMNLDSSIWTIVVEIRAALVFPLLLWLCRDSRRGLFGALTLYVISTLTLRAMRPAIDDALLDTENFWLTLLVTARSLTFFLFGILLAKHRKALCQVLSRYSTKYKYILGFFCLFIFCLPHFPEETLPEGIAAGIILILVLTQPRLQQLLTTYWLAWLGRISFSLYLLHLPVYFVTFHFLLGLLTFGPTLAIAIATALATAALMQRWVEAPAQALGHRLTRPPNPIADTVG